MFTDYYSGSRYDSEQMVIDDDYANLRRDLWLATDRAYKTASEAIGRKQAALKNMTQVEQLPDYWKAPPVEVMLPAARFEVDRKKWTNRVRSLSALFLEYPEVLSSAVSFGENNSQRYMVNSEGSRIRVPEPLSTFEIRGQGYSHDGGVIRDAISFLADTPDGLPSESELKQATTQVAANIRSLLSAPLGEPYTGPVLFDGVAAPQLIADLLGGELGVTRRPLSEPGRPVPFRASELEGRVGSRILPEFIDVLDDPTRKEYDGKRVYGDYPVDEEGVVPPPVHLVEKGKLTTLLLTRQPVKGFSASNGRARLPGPYGAHTPVFSNLIVTASVSVPGVELKKKLIEMATARQKPYGILIRKMDYPSSASLDEIRRIAVHAQQAGGSEPASLLAAAGLPGLSRRTGRAGPRAGVPGRNDSIAARHLGRFEQQQRVSVPEQPGPVRADGRGRVRGAIGRSVAIASIRGTRTDPAAGRSSERSRGPGAAGSQDAMKDLRRP